MAGSGDCAGISSANHMFALAGGPGAVAQDGLSAAGSSLLLAAASRIVRCVQRQLRWGSFLFSHDSGCSAWLYGLHAHVGQASRNARVLSQHRLPSPCCHPQLVITI